METNGRALIEVIESVRRPRSLCLEKSTHSAWLHEVLSPHIDELVVTQVHRHTGSKSDEKNAFGLADAHRLGTVLPVFKGASRRSAGCAR